MSEEHRAAARAEGSLDYLRDELSRKFEAEGRSDEYVKAFWENFYSYCTELGRDH